MSEEVESDFSFNKWARERQEYVKKSITRAEAFRDIAIDSVAFNEKNAFMWLVSIFLEIKNIYSALIILDSKQESIKDDIDLLNNVLKNALGLQDSQVTKEQVNERANEFGKFVQGIIDRQKEIESNL